MKNKSLAFVSGIPAALLAVFVLAGFAGCATTPQAGLSAQADGGGGTEDAAQLAADLGKAAIDDTVTLSGWIRLKTALVVPEGVTLDLTAEGAALELQDGAVLTVNGTVNARPDGIRVGDGEAVINGSGTINLKSKGSLLNIGSDKARRHLTLEGITLVGLPDNGSSLVGVWEGGELVLKSGKITGNTHIRNDGKWVSAGGVYVNGEFIMQGGEIYGNTANDSGSIGSGTGGVRVENGGEFIMQGGKIYGNTAVSGLWSGSGGVGVWMGTFTMEGGEIYGNTATGGNGTGAGGVDIGGEGSTFTLNGGTIYGAIDGLPDGADQSLANFARPGLLKNGHAALNVDDKAAAKWGSGGTYTKGGVPQKGGSDIGDANDTLIAVPGR